MDTRRNRRLRKLATWATVVLALASALPVFAEAGKSAMQSVLTLPGADGAVGGQGSFDASARDGSGQYSIPFELPPGRGGMTPSLGLSYSSRAGYGEGGLGWSLGVPRISRDLSYGAPRYEDAPGWTSAEDRLTGGGELVPVTSFDWQCAGIDVATGINVATGSCGDVPSEYATWARYVHRVNDRGRIFRNPQWTCFVELRPDGSRLEYGDCGAYPGTGNRDGSIEREAGDVQDARKFAWNLTRQVDVHGASIWYVWDRSEINDRQDVPRLTDVYYVEPAATTPDSPPTSLAAFAVHVQLGWTEAPPHVSFESGVAAVRRHVLNRVDSYVRLARGTSRPRNFTRRMRFTHDAAPNGMPLLVGAQTFGRQNDGTLDVEPFEGNEAVLSSLPPQTFGYSGNAVGVVAEPIAIATQDSFPAPTLNSSPQGLDGTRDLMDVDGDGRFDVLETSGDGSTVRAYLHQPTGGFVMQDLAVVAPPDVYLPRLDDSSTRPGDLDSDGRPELVKQGAGALSRAHVQVVAGSRQWHVAAWTPVGAIPVFDANTRTLDIDRDGRSDFVRSDSNSLQVWRNVGTSTAPQFVAEEDQVLCLDGAPVDPNVGRFTDVNGDGVADFVLVDATEILVFAGRGHGRFGQTNVDAACDAISGESTLDWTWTNPSDQFIDLADLTGDGLVDIVRLSGADVAVFPGRIVGSDLQFGDVASAVTATLPGAASTSLRFADVNGDGVDDVVSGAVSNGSWPFATFVTEVPNLLVSIDNGLGATTQIAYGSVSEELARDRAICDAADAAGIEDEDCFRWEGHALGGADEGLHSLRHLWQVVTSITTTVAGGAGLAAEERTITRQYHDADYSGADRWSLGFGATDVCEQGDANHPGSCTRSHFLQARRPAALAGDPTVANPYEAAQGREWLTETDSIPAEGSPVYASTVLHGFQIRRLAVAQNGEWIVGVVPTSTDRFVYGTAAAQTPAESPNHVVLTSGGVECQDDSDPLCFDDVELPYRVRANADVAHLRNSVDPAYWSPLGGALRSVSHGQVGVDAPIEQRAERQLLNANGRYVLVTTRTSVVGSGLESPEYQVATYMHDPNTGSVTRETRVHDAPAAFDFGDAGTTTPLESVTSMAYDAWGQVTRTCVGDPDPTSANCLRASTITYDADYAQAPIAEAFLVSRDPVRVLTTTSEFDRDHGILSVSGPDGATSTVNRDGLGRVVETLRPSVGCNQVSAYTEIVPGAPFSQVIVRDATGCGTYREARSLVDGLGRTRGVATESDDGQMVVSGLQTFTARGTVHRTYQSASGAWTWDNVHQALAIGFSQPHASVRYDAFGRVVETTDELGASTTTTYHALSEVVRDALDGVANTVHHDTPSITRRDGHGRVIQNVTAMRDVAGETPTFLHLLSRYRADGVLTSVVRAESNVDAAVAMGAPPPVHPSHPGHVVERIHHLDSQGRVHAVQDASFDGASGGSATTSLWRYLYNVAGDLVSVRDPRGCGRDLFYDYGGRTLGERFVGCDEAVESPDPSYTLTGAIGVGVGNADVHVRTWYDAYPSPSLGFGTPPRGAPQNQTVVGRVAATADLTQQSQSFYDARGRVTQTQSRLARAAFTTSASEFVVAPGDAEVDPDSSILTGDGHAAVDPDVSILLGGGAGSEVEFDENTTYTSTVTYDELNRVVSRTYPEDPDFARLTDDKVEDVPAIVGHAQYTAVRGLPENLEVSVGGVGYPVFNNPTYTHWGALASAGLGRGYATIDNTFDPMRRLASTRAELLRNDDGSGSGLRRVNVPLHQTYVYDAIGNLVQIGDLRDPDEWEPGHRPFTTQITHNTRGQVIEVDRLYAGSGADSYSDWRDELTQMNVAPDGHEVGTHLNADPMRQRPAPRLAAEPTNRMNNLLWEHNFLGSTSWTNDDAGQFFERSIGTVSHGVGHAGHRPSAPYLATDLTTDGETGLARGSYLTVTYGESGNMRRVVVHTECTQCDPEGDDPSELASSLRNSCTCQNEQAYVYAYDELNRLVEARRYDRTGGSGDWNARARRGYAYDAGSVRRITLSTPFDEAGIPSTERATLYVEPRQMERRGVEWIDSTWRGSESLGTETVYTVAGARVVRRPNASSSGDAIEPDFRITYALTDRVGSSVATLDLVSGALLSAGSYLPNGARDELQTTREASLALDPRGFTGPEADSEVGVANHHHRWLFHVLGWITPDPAEIATPGGGGLVGNAYHYVGANPLDLTDLSGLSPFGDVMKQQWNNLTAGTNPQEAFDTVDTANDVKGVVETARDAYRVTEATDVVPRNPSWDMPVALDLPGSDSAARHLTRGIEVPGPWTIISDTLSLMAAAESYGSRKHNGGVPFANLDKDVQDLTTMSLVPLSFIPLIGIYETTFGLGTLAVEAHEDSDHQKEAWRRSRMPRSVETIGAIRQREWERSGERFLADSLSRHAAHQAAMENAPRYEPPSDSPVFDEQIVHEQEINDAEFFGEDPIGAACYDPTCSE